MIKVRDLLCLLGESITINITAKALVGKIEVEHTERFDEAWQVGDMWKDLKVTKLKTGLEILSITVEEVGND